jgi:hypothetical protein
MDDFSYNLLTYDDLRISLGELTASYNQQFNAIRGLLETIAERVGEVTQVPKAKEELKRRAANLSSLEPLPQYSVPLLFGEPSNHCIHASIVGLDHNIGCGMRIICDYFKILTGLFNQLSNVDTTRKELSELQMSYRSLLQNYEEQRVTLTDFQKHYQLESVRQCILEDVGTSMVKKTLEANFRQSYLQLLKKKAAAYDRIVATQARLAFETVLGEGFVPLRDRIIRCGQILDPEIQFEDAWSVEECKKHVLSLARDRVIGDRLEGKDPNSEFYRVSAQVLTRFRDASSA